jgi:hypothetical protein
MLPGFRFLFAAIMLSMSLLVFGLGAAALLRAAHESFASNSSWRAAPEVSFAQRAEPTLPMLATLRVDTPVVEKIPEQAPPAASSADTSPPPQAPAAISAPATSEQLGALRPVDAAPAETMTSELAPPAAVIAEDLPPATTPPAAEAAATGDQSTIAQTTIAVVTTPGAASSGASEPASAPPEPASAPPATPVADQASIAITRIATLGGPPVDVTEDTIKDPPPARARTAKPDPAKNDQSAIKRRVEAKRVVHRRRLSARARLAAQQQLQSNPFGQQPFPPTTSAAPHP